MTAILMLGCVFLLIIAAFAGLIAWTDNENGLGMAVLMGTLAFVAAVVLGLGLAYEAWWSSASAAQKTDLAQALAHCPDTRRSAQPTIRQGLTSGEANDLIDACAQERLLLQVAGDDRGS